MFFDQSLNVFCLLQYIFNSAICRSQARMKKEEGLQFKKCYLSCISNALMKHRRVVLTVRDLLRMLLVLKDVWLLLHILREVQDDCPILKLKSCLVLAATPLFDYISV